MLHFNLRVCTNWHQFTIIRINQAFDNVIQLLSQNITQYFILVTTKKTNVNIEEGQDFKKDLGCASICQ